MLDYRSVVRYDVAMTTTQNEIRKTMETLYAAAAEQTGAVLDYTLAQIADLAAEYKAAS